MKKLLFSLLLFFFIIIGLGFIPSGKLIIPVEFATVKDWNKKSFWQHPWGKSVTHKGIDIFAPYETTVKSSCQGLVVYAGPNGRGGITALILGSKWRMHYYAHLSELTVGAFEFVSQGERIGYVGTSGNAVGKSPHLHYSIRSLIPYPWLWDNEPQGHLKMWYLNPDKFLRPWTAK